jgi:hypothetical protein
MNFGEASLDLIVAFIPELNALKGLTQRGRHQFDVFEHSRRVAEKLPERLKLVGWLHDTGKAATQTIHAKDSTRFSFLGHAEMGAGIADSVCRRLQLPEEERRRTVELVRLHMLPHQLESRMSRRGVRSLVQQAGELLEDLLLLTEADSGSLREDSDGKAVVAPLREAISSLYVADASPETGRLLVLTRAQVGAIVGLQPGPELAAVMARLKATVEADPSLNTKEGLAALANG